MFPFSLHYSAPHVHSHPLLFPLLPDSALSTLPLSKLFNLPPFAATSSYQCCRHRPPLSNTIVDLKAWGFFMCLCVSIGMSVWVLHVSGNKNNNVRGREVHMLDTDTLPKRCPCFIDQYEKLKQFKAQAYLLKNLHKGS